MKSLETGLVAFVGLTIVAGAAIAAPPGETGASGGEGQRPELTLPAELLDGAFALSQAMRVYIDPATGRFRAPTSEELQEVSQAAQRVASAATAPVEFELAAGGVGVAVPPELVSVSTVRIDDGGQPVLQCSAGTQQVETAVAPATSSLEEEK